MPLVIFVPGTDGLAYDWMSNKLYVTDEILDVISVLDISTLNYTVLIRTGFSTRPRAIVLDPYAGYVHYTCQQSYFLCLVSMILIDSYILTSYSCGHLLKI